MIDLLGGLFGKLADYAFWTGVMLWLRANLGLVLSVSPYVVLSLLLIAHICPWGKLGEFRIPLGGWIVLAALFVPTSLVGLGDVVGLYCLKGEACQVAQVGKAPKPNSEPSKPSTTPKVVPPPNGA